MIQKLRSISMLQWAKWSNLIFCGFNIFVIINNPSGLHSLFNAFAAGLSLGVFFLMHEVIKHKDTRELMDRIFTHAEEVNDLNKQLIEGKIELMLRLDSVLSTQNGERPSVH